MNELTTLWRSLRPQIGDFINRIEAAVLKAEKMEDAEKFGKEMYDKGCSDGIVIGRNQAKESLCCYCKKKDFYNDFSTRSRGLIDLFNKLPSDDKDIVISLLERLSEIRDDENEI